MKRKKLWVVVTGDIPAGQVACMRGRAMTWRQNKRKLSLLQGANFSSALDQGKYSLFFFFFKRKDPFEEFQRPLFFFQASCRVQATTSHPGFLFQRNEVTIITIITRGRIDSLLYIVKVVSTFQEMGMRGRTSTIFCAVWSFLSKIKKIWWESSALVADKAWLVVFALGRQRVCCWCAGNFLLLGDLAHSTRVHYFLMKKYVPDAKFLRLYSQRVYDWMSSYLESYNI